MRSQRTHACAPTLPAALIGIVAIVSAGGLACSKAVVRPRPDPLGPSLPATPIQHLVIIIQENRSFDHYFGMYPHAADVQDGSPRFTPLPGTPDVNGLGVSVTKHNPNLAPPFLLGGQTVVTCDPEHEYSPLQRAYDHGLLDRFVQELSPRSDQTPLFCGDLITGKYTISMGHFDGNTVTALWSYAQHFAMSDNYFATTFGPSTVGAINLVGADNAGVLCAPPKGSVHGEVPVCPDSGAPALLELARTATNYTDPPPLWDACAEGLNAERMAMGFKNVGDLLTEAGVSWGFFQGGFKMDAQGKCSSAHSRVYGGTPVMQSDYISHHNPFQYYASTSNRDHLPPESVEDIGKTDRANHLYDLQDFWAAAATGNVPAVSFLRAPGYQDGHPSYSGPLDEQEFLVKTLNALQQLPQWRDMAVILTYDDPGGWYDHVMPPIINQSSTPLDTHCGSAVKGPQARCGYGPRLPLLVISPFARRNHVDSVLLDQTSITRFIEDNWLEGRRISAESFDNWAGSLLGMLDYTQPPSPAVFLDPRSGKRLDSPP